MLFQGEPIGRGSVFPVVMFASLLALRAEKTVHKLKVTFIASGVFSDRPVTSIDQTFLTEVLPGKG